MRGNLPSWFRWGLAAALIGGLAVGTLFLSVLARGPRMRDQVHLSTFEARMPLPPVGSVPVGPGVAPAVEDDRTDPLTLSAAVERGRVYYCYYCLACHGEEGRGDGPVGDSYMPRPTDLRSPKLQDYSESRLLQAMLTGVGHEPVLPRVVPPAHRPYLVLFLREVAKREVGMGE